MKKRVLVVFVVLVLFLFSVPAMAATRLIVGTAGTVGMSYPMGGAMSRIWSSQVPDVSASPQVTGGSIENTRLLEQKEIELGLQSTIIAYFSWNGLEMFKDKPVRTIRSVASLVPEITQIIVRADSGINSIKDFKGKKVAIAPPGSMEMISHKLIVEACGVPLKDMDAKFLSYAESSNQFKDRLLDGVMYTTGLGTSAIQDIASMQKIKLLSIPAEVITKLSAEYKFYVPNTVPANTYNNQSNAVKTLSVKNALVCRDSLPEDLVYKLTKTLFENLSVFEKSHAMAKYFTLKTALEGLAYPLHPGAEKYYKEVGMIKK